MKSTISPAMTAAAFAASLLIPNLATAQTKPVRTDGVAHHHYKLQVIPSLGGQEGNFYDDLNNIGVLNDRGAASGGAADTAMRDPFPNWPWGDAGMSTHAYIWTDGTMTDLGALTDTFSSFSGWISANGIVVGVSQNGQFDPLVPGSVDPSVPDFPEGTAVL
ncbi:MAG TPA: hypothetical protein VMU96_11030, partial [Casimicrobiaceae bacterium]|nr:hypothetical protein [Casimicrobiaceae bacterium]